MPSGPSIRAKKLATSARVRAGPVRPSRAIAARREKIPAIIFSTIATIKKKWNRDISAKGFGTSVIIAPHITVSVLLYTRTKTAPENRRIA